MTIFKELEFGACGFSQVEISGTLVREGYYKGAIMDFKVLLILSKHRVDITDDIEDNWTTEFKIALIEAIEGQGND